MKKKVLAVTMVTAFFAASVYAQSAPKKSIKIDKDNVLKASKINTENVRKAAQTNVVKNPENIKKATQILNNNKLFFSNPENLKTFNRLVQQMNAKKKSRSQSDQVAETVSE